MLTDHDAELIAKHVVRLMRKDLMAVALATKQQVAEEVSEETLDSHEAAKFLGIAYNTLKKYRSRYPYHQERANGKIIYFKSELKKFMS